MAHTIYNILLNRCLNGTVCKIFKILNDSESV